MLPFLLLTMSNIHQWQAVSRPPLELLPSRLHINWSSTGCPLCLIPLWIIISTRSISQGFCLVPFPFWSSQAFFPSGLLWLFTQRLGKVYDQQRERQSSSCQWSSQYRNDHSQLHPCTWKSRKYTPSRTSEVQTHPRPPWILSASICMVGPLTLVHPSIWWKAWG